MLVTFRFYAQLNDFLPSALRRVRFPHHLRTPASLKDTVEAIGVPHPEVDLLLVNGVAAAFDRRLAGGDDVAVFPRLWSLDVTATRVGADPPLPVRFVADVHLGKLASYLRLAGFDTRLAEHDAEVANMSMRDERVALTRDVALLKRSAIRHGRWVRSTDPEVQLQEVAAAFDLAAQVQPFTRCLVCNGLVDDVEAASVAATVPPGVSQTFDAFRRCRDCRRVYWRGTHYARLLQVLEGMRLRSR